MVLGEDGVEPGADQAAEWDLLLVGDRPQLVPNLRIDVDGDHHAGRTVLVGLDRPPGTPPRGARQDLLKIRCGLRQLWLRDEESEPLDYAAELGSRPPGRLVLADRQTEGAGVSPGGPVAEGMRTDTQTKTLDGTAGLVGPLPTGRDLDEHGHGERIARQGEQLGRRRHRLQVDYLGPAGNDHQTFLPWWLG